MNKYNFKEYLPIGKLAPTLKRLEEWQIDEIIILNKSHSLSVRDDLLSFTRDISGIDRINTPWAYGGGVRNLDDVRAVINFGFERVVITSKAILQSELLDEISSIWGQQAVIVHIPYLYQNHSILVKTDDGFEQIENLVEHKLNNFRGEILMTSINSEGDRIVNFEEVNFAISKIPKNINIIYSGGIYRDKDFKRLSNMKINGIALGNVLNTKELLVPRIKMENSLRFRVYKHQMKDF